MSKQTPSSRRLAPPRKTLRQLLSRGEHWLYLTGAALSVALIMIAGLLAVVVFNGAGFFWSRDIVRVERPGKDLILGIQTGHQPARIAADGTVLTAEQTQFKVGGRELFGSDFIWVPSDTLGESSKPEDVVSVEREQNGDLYAFLRRLQTSDGSEHEGPQAWVLLQEMLPKIRTEVAEVLRIQRNEIGRINYKLRAANLETRRIDRTMTEGTSEHSAALAEVEKHIEALNADYEVLRKKAEELQISARQPKAIFEAVDGREVTLSLADIVSVHKPNAMSVVDKIALYGRRAVGFVSGEPRESNTEGGVWPALFGTVLMTLLMSLAVTPFGVLAALYLREYAKQGPVVRAVRIAINNLAGVPSIVFGVFGLGFFIYTVGGWIDRSFYPDALPTPTFGTGGILWASLTLALLTVPVVIVATEESLAAVPRGVREGSLALGASKFQTVLNVVLPAAVPGILTGIILAMARGAGEVAPLMITGVVKLAPELPFDLDAPFLHLDRKFMHLGFHIYDVGFQSPNVEAAKPMVFTTTLLLILIVVLLNIVAIRTRDRLRRKFQSGAFS